MSCVFWTVALFVVLSVSFVPSPTESLTVHVVPHTHDDVGWLITVDQYYSKYVQYILDTVVVELQLNPNRKFIYVEQAFFQRWWREQNEDIRNQTRSLVKNRQLEFINGAWSMHDEGCTHYIDMIDQTTLGHTYIKQEFGMEALPTIGWQIDPFGHSATQASLLSASLGFDGLFFARIDYEDRANRLARKELEFIWRASPSLGETAQVFTGAFHKNDYGPPPGMCWDGAGPYTCSDTDVQSDSQLHDYNIPALVNNFKNQAYLLAGGTAGNLSTMNVMFTMGSDFQYSNAHHWFINLDRIIDAVNADGEIQAIYSTPSLYVAAKNKEQLSLTVKTDDFFPYADGPHSQMVGYFSSRPALKRYVRITSNFLQIARHLEVINGGNGSTTQPLWESQGVVQHHDGVSGSSVQVVAFDYAMRLYADSVTADALIENTLASLTVISQPAAPFSYCPLLNISRCSASETNTNMVLVIWNPLARTARQLIIIPVPNHSMYVLNSSALAVQYSVLPTFNTTARDLHGMPYEIQFQADLLPLGFTTYFLITSFNDNDSQQNEEERNSLHQQPLLSMSDDSSIATPTTSAASSRTNLKRLHRHTTMSFQRANVQTISAAQTIENEYWLLSFNSSGWLVSATNKTNGMIHTFVTEILWYQSYYDGDKSQSSGSYDFRPQNQSANSFTTTGNIELSIVSHVANSNATIGNNTAEARQKFNDSAYLITRLRQGSWEIDIEYVVGPIPIADGNGKEFILRYTTDIMSNATWYTDSNGREMQLRIRNQRQSFKYMVYEPIASNYYPVNALLVINDTANSLAILPDRSHGCTSIVDGQVELMLHRRLTHDDHYGENDPLNEQETLSDGTVRGLTIKGKHQILLTSSSTLYAQARSIQSRVYAEPHIAFSKLTGSSQHYRDNYNTNYTLLTMALPSNIDLITFQAFPQSMGDNTILLRLSHLFGIGEDPILSAPVTIDLAKVFKWPIMSLTAVSLTATKPISQHNKQQRLEWITIEEEKNINNKRSSSPQNKGGLDGTIVSIGPAQVLAFLATFDRSIL